MKPGPSNPRRRRLGQVFTPPPVADFMTRWAACGHPTKRWLDPALGAGIFVDCIARLTHRRSPAGSVITACEIDPRMIHAFRAARSANGSPPIHVQNCDFIRAKLLGSFDAIVANPPYVRHHELPYPDAAWQTFDRLVGRRLPRTTNLYGLFLLRIWSLLAPRGRAAVITPAEWLNADFGAAIKACLLRENAIDEIIYFHPRADVFNGVLTTAAITLLRRGRRPNEPIRFRLARSAARLDTARVTGTHQPSDLDPAAKWIPLFDRSPARTVALPAPNKNKKSTAVPLGRWARCVRGIATGANRYFVLRPSELRAARIDRRDVRICISKSAHVPGLCLTPADVARLIARDERIFLLDPRTPLSPGFRRYLARGRALGIHRRYLPAHRPVWYRPERRPPAPIWVTVFARDGFRFVRNEAAVLNLTAFHAIYPRDGIDADRLHAALCRPQTQRRIASQQRHYADGLRKLEPRDVERIELPGPLPANGPAMPATSNSAPSIVRTPPRTAFASPR